MSAHDEIRELIAVVALGAATAVEEASVERHAATCHECRAELDSSRAAAAQLALEVPQLDPPPDLKRKVMTAVRESSPGRLPAPVAPRRRWFAWPAAAGALAVVAAGLLAWNVTLQGGDGIREIPVAVTSDAPAGVTGSMTIDESGAAVIRVANLPELAPDQSYELWTIRDGKPRSEGFAARTADGEIVVATADLEGATALAITPEPRSNTRAPTGDQVVVVDLQGVV